MKKFLVIASCLLIQACAPPVTQRPQVSRIERDLEARHQQELLRSQVIPPLAEAWPECV